MNYYNTVYALNYEMLLSYMCVSDLVHR